MFESVAAKMKGSSQGIAFDFISAFLKSVLRDMSNRGAEMFMSIP
jgi:hypothetical protein